MGEKNKSTNKKFLVLLILGLLFLIGGLLITYFSSAKQVTTRVVNTLSKNVVDLIDDVTKQTGLEENFKTIQTLKINLQSDYFNALANMNPTYTTISKLLTNLSNTENTITIIQDKTNKKRFISYDSKLAGKPLITSKQLIENATEYYYVSGVTPNYINNGNNNYFESLDSTTTNIENEKYIIKKVTESITKNLKDEYLEESYEGNNKKITFILDENNLIELTNNILKDLKNDSKANTIMTGYNKDFSKTKITKEDVKGLKTTKLNIYLDKFTLKVNKYELSLADAKVIYYEEKEKAWIEFYTKDMLNQKLEIMKKADKTEINILDSSNKSLGTISISKTKTNFDIVANIASEGTNIDISYNGQITNLKKGKSYDSSTTIKMNISSNNMTLINGTISLTGKTSNDTTMNEDLSNSILASSLPETEALLNQKMTNILITLMS